MVDRRADALRRLKIKPDDLRNLPPITTLLQQAQGGKRAVIKAMRFSEDPVVIQFFEKYDSLPLADRDRVPLEAICFLADINPTHLLGSALLALREHSVNAVKVIAISNHPGIIRKRVEFAKLPGGGRDRDALDTALGFLPTNKGTTFVNRQIITAAGGSAVSDDDSDEKTEMIDDEDYAFPDLSQVQKSLTPIRQKMLEGK